MPGPVWVKVTAPAVVVRNPDKGERYLYAGAVFASETVRDGEIERLLELGFLEKVAAADYEGLESVADPEPAVEPVDVEDVEVVEVEALTVDELKAHLDARGIPHTSGMRKDDLIALARQ